jgi:hypothetical protein
MSVPAGGVHTTETVVRVTEESPRPVAAPGIVKVVVEVQADQVPSPWAFQPWTFQEYVVPAVRADTTHVVAVGSAMLANVPVPAQDAPEYRAIVWFAFVPEPSAQLTTATVVVPSSAYADSPVGAPGIVRVGTFDRTAESALAPVPFETVASKQ